MEANIVAFGAATAALARAGEWQRALCLMAGFNEAQCARSQQWPYMCKACHVHVRYTGYHLVVRTSSQNHISVQSIIN